MDFILILDLLGTFAFAISGVRMAARVDMDVFGAAVVGFATAIGGGTTRDLLLGRHPITWIDDISYPMVILAAIPFTYLLRNKLITLNKPLFIFDTIGLAVFTISGMEKALEVGVNPFIAALMGMITGVVGGIIRDIFCHEIPLIFRKEIYATACLAGALIFYAGLAAGINADLNYLLTIITIIIIRSVAIRYNLALPKMKA